MDRPRRERDNDEYLAFLARIVRGAGDRLADANEGELRQLLELRDVLDNAIRHAVVGMHASGATWQEIGEATGTSRQAAHQKWGLSS